jgi:hypothetical protein
MSLSGGCSNVLSENVIPAGEIFHEFFVTVQGNIKYKRKKELLKTPGFPLSQYSLVQICNGVKKRTLDYRQRKGIS